MEAATRLSAIFTDRGAERGTPQSPKHVSEVLSAAYPQARGLTRALIRARPYICPFHEMLTAIPSGRSFIDVGCGVGLMSILLAHLRDASRVIGVDTSNRALATAQRAIVPDGCDASFRKVLPTSSWPEDAVTSVVCLDVLHHVKQSAQRDFVRRLANLNFTETIYFKDVSPTPGWKALGSHFHDLIIARERIHIRDEFEVRRWFEDENLKVRGPVRLDTQWYTHYFMTASRV